MMKRKSDSLGILVLLTLLLLGCAAPTEVQVTREVIITQEVQTEVEVTREVTVPVEVTRLVEVTPESWADPFSESSLNSEIIIETMQTEAFDETFRLYIWLPESYESRPDHNFPVLYLMDGNYDTRLASLLAWNLNFEGSVPELMIVGVGYDTNDEAELLDLRLRDLLPAGTREGYGRANDLLAFMQNELIPHIDSTYHTLPTQRFLAGFSAGGTFTLYSMFHAPDMFKGFIATSPALEYAGWSANPLFRVPMGPLLAWKLLHSGLV